MRRTHWLIGFVFGAIAGGAWLVAGVLVWLIGLPMLVWAATERMRPFGFAGLVVGFGVGFGGFITLANAMCGADPTCSMIDLSPYAAVALSSGGLGGLLTLVAWRRAGREDIASTAQDGAMPDTAGYAVGCGAVLGVFAFLLVAAPSYMAPLFDSAVSVGGLPAGLVVVATLGLVLSVVGLVAVSLAHRAESRLGVVVGLIVVAAISFYLAPAVILVIKNMKV